MTTRSEHAAQLKSHLAAASALADALALETPAEPTSPVSPAPPQPAPAGRLPFADEGKFYDFLRGNSMLGPKISPSEYEGCNAILAACAAARFPTAYTAYVLSTAYHETAHTMQPIKEYGGQAYYTRLYDVTGQNPERAKKHGNVLPGDGARYCGRGYVQLTWKKNYERAGRELGVDLVANPDLAMQPAIAAQIMVRGMAEGWFTGRRLSGQLSADFADQGQFREARRIINGTDRAADLASYALQFQQALQAGGWRNS